MFLLLYLIIYYSNNIKTNNQRSDNKCKSNINIDKPESFVSSRELFHKDLQTSCFVCLVLD